MESREDRDRFERLQAVEARLQREARELAATLAQLEGEKRIAERELHDLRAASRALQREIVQLRPGNWDAHDRPHLVRLALAIAASAGFLLAPIMWRAWW